MGSDTGQVQGPQMRLGGGRNRQQMTDAVLNQLTKAGMDLRTRRGQYIGGGIGSAAVLAGILGLANNDEEEQMY